MIPTLQIGQFGRTRRITDPYIDSVVLFAPLQDVAGSTPIDYSPRRKTLSLGGNAAISATNAKWGGTSLALDGNGDYVDATWSSEFNLPADFTIEGWFRLTDYSTDRYLINIGGRSGSTTQTILLGTNASPGKPYFQAYSDSVGTNIVNLTSSTGLTLGTWQHIAAVRSGNSWFMFLDGSQVATTTASGTPWTASSQLQLGGYSNNTATKFFAGNMADVRITKAARWTAAFSPPTGPLPR